MSEPEDHVAQLISLLDQLEAMYRDTIAQSVVRMEKTVLQADGSPELALAFSVEWGSRLLTVTKLGVLDA